MMMSKTKKSLHIVKLLDLICEEIRLKTRFAEGRTLTTKNKTFFSRFLYLMKAKTVKSVSDSETLSITLICQYCRRSVNQHCYISNCDQ